MAPQVRGVQENLLVSNLHFLRIIQAINNVCQYDMLNIDVIFGVCVRILFMIGSIINNKIENLLIEVKGQKGLLDSDVAVLYGVATKEVNQAVSNNFDKFPEGYILKLDKEAKDKVVKKFDHLKNLRFSPHLPKAFTEKGLYMLATILKSPQATKSTIAIIETFSKIGELSKTINQLSKSNKKEITENLMQKSGEIFPKY